VFVKHTTESLAHALYTNIGRSHPGKFSLGSIGSFSERWIFFNTSKVRSPFKMYRLTFSKFWRLAKRNLFDFTCLLINTVPRTLSLFSILLVNPFFSSMVCTHINCTVTKIMLYSRKKAYDFEKKIHLLICFIRCSNIIYVPGSVFDVHLKIVLWNYIKLYHQIRSVFILY